MRQFRRKPRLTLHELDAIMRFYHGRFPDWKVIQRDLLVREDGPVVQGIAFERLSDGEYRPTGHIHVLIAPSSHWPLELSQWLNVRVRQIERRRDTPEVRESVIRAIHGEFVPQVGSPLCAEQVLSLYEARATPTSPEAYSLASLNAYFGHDERALHWCSRFTDLVNKSGISWQGCDLARRSLLDKLETWIQVGTARQELDRVLVDARRKWGLQ